MVVNQQPPRQVGEALLYDGILWVHPEGNALNHAEGPQDEGKVGWDLERVVSRKAIQLCSDLQQMSCGTQAMQHHMLCSGCLFQRASRLQFTQHQAEQSTAPDLVNVDAPGTAAARQL